MSRPEEAEPLDGGEAMRGGCLGVLGQMFDYGDEWPRDKLFGLLLDMEYTREQVEDALYVLKQTRGIQAHYVCPADSTLHQVVYR